jgi:hypothetical protein
MSDTNAILDQAQAELRAGRKAEAWKLTAAIVKADPQNARAWRVLADISEKDAPDRAAGYRAKAEAAEANARLGPPMPAGPAPGSTHHVQRLPSMEQPQPHQGPPGPYQQPPQYPAAPHPPTQYQQPPQYAPQTPSSTIPPPKRSLGATIIQIIIALLILAGAVVVISRGLRNTNRNRSAAPPSSFSATRTPLAITPEILTGAALDAEFDRIEAALDATTAPAPAAVPLAELDLAPLALQSGDLPAGYSGAQVSDALPAMFNDAPAPAKVFDQRFQKSDEDAGGVTIVVYETGADLTTAYDLAVDGMLDDNVAADIGDGARVAGGTVSTLDVAEGVFTRCQTLVFVRFSGTKNTESVVAYMKRLDTRLFTVACAAP